MKGTGRWTLAAALLAVWTAHARAGSVEVAVRDQDGRPVDRQFLVLRTLSIDAEDPGRRDAYSRGRRGTTDADGRITFPGVEPGRYAVELGALAEPDLVRPEANPFAPPPAVTLLDGEEDVRAEVELWRGVRVTAALVLPEPEARMRFRAVFRHPATGFVVASPFPRDHDFVDGLLVPGIWEATVEAPPGYLLVAVERERLPVDGHAVRLDLGLDLRGTYLTFTYAAPCEVTGLVTEERGQSPRVSIEATLRRPGSWIEAARRRGGSSFERVEAAVDERTGRYEMVLPDGAWRIRPVGELLLASEPEAVDLELTPGEIGRADFSVRLEEGLSETFIVKVEDARRRAVAKAAVEVHRLDEPGEPLRAGASDRFGTARLRPGLPAGDYLVVAGHASTLEGRLEVREYDPEAAGRAGTVVLGRGAELRLEARDPGGRPLPEVRLTVERRGDPPDLVLVEPAVAAAKARRTAVTDRSGRLAIGGFYPGVYEVRAELGGGRRPRGLIDVALAGGEPRPALEIEIEGDERVDLEARLRPAASIGASLVCADGGPLWDTADLRVVDPRKLAAAEDSSRPPSARGDPNRGVVLALDAVPLTGQGRDTVTAGPLAEGVYLLAVRPAGFDRWTWAFETHDIAEAAEIQVEVGESQDPEVIDLGLFHVECAPAVDLLPEALTGDPLPDLAEVAVAARILGPDGERETHRPPAIHRRAERIELRGLPPGEILLAVTLSHPCFLPRPDLTWEIPLALERGAFRVIVPEVEALGGAVVVRWAAGSASLYGPGVEIRGVPLERGEALFPSLVPGTYRLELDGGARGGPVRVWSELEVRAGEILRLDD